MKRFSVCVRTCVLSIALIVFFLNSRAQGVDVTLRIRGVYDASVAISKYENGRYDKPLQTVPGVTSEVKFNVPAAKLPGQFLLRMNYRQKASDQPYPSEFIFYLNKNNIELGINPLYVHGDSVRYKNDPENPVFKAFSAENAVRRQQLAIVSQVVDGYTDRDGRFYKEAIKEFWKLSNNYNQWIDEQTEANRSTYVSHFFPLQKIVPKQEVTDQEQMEQQRLHYFDFVDFNDTLLLNTQAFNEFINTYMSMFGMQATTEELRDSLFTEAGRIACEKASAGDPKLYGWMVDYFYRGYESYNINSGMTMLRKYIDDPRCLTSKKQEILKRLEGMQRMKEGSDAPPFEAEMFDGMKLHFEGVSKQKEYEMIIFYESECSHCKEFLKELAQWYQVPQNATWFDIISVALDDERKTWEINYQKNKFAWHDVWAPGGVNSKAANDYYILSTPVIFIVDKNMKVVSMPSNMADVKKFLNN